MGYDLDLQTKKKGAELDALWDKLKEAVLAKFNSVPKEERLTQSHDQVEAWCSEVAADLNLSFRREDDWLCFTDKALAPN